MTASPAGKSLRKTPLFTPYVVVWSMFGALSFGYLSILAIAPEWLDDLRPASFTADPQSNQGQRAAARLAAEVNGLRDSVGQIQLDLAKIKTDVATQADHDRAFGAHLSALEQKLGTPPPQLIEAAAPASPPAATATADTAVIQDPSPAPAATTAAAGEAAEQTERPFAVPGSAQQPTLINADTQITTTTLETGSVGTVATANAVTTKADTISFGPAVVKPAPKPLGLRISSGASVDSLRLSWSLLADSHGETLKNMQARYTSNGDIANPNFDLIAGPVKSKAEAMKACKALAAKNVPCKVGEFTGDAL